jgi:peptide deformylase
MPILTWPDVRLNTPCVAIGNVTRQVRALADDMLETMYAAPGRGLAAPQVGVMQRLFVMDAGWKSGTPTPMVCIDPEITPIGTEMSVHEEGCLSIPGVLTQITRPARVHMTWTDIEGARTTGEFDGFEALCAQHELDHLDGIVTFDRLSREDREAAVSRYQSAQA